MTAAERAASKCGGEFPTCRGFDKLETRRHIPATAWRKIVVTIPQSRWRRFCYRVVTCLAPQNLDDRTSEHGPSFSLSRRGDMKFLSCLLLTNLLFFVLFLPAAPAQAPANELAVKPQALLKTHC